MANNWQLKTLFLKEVLLIEYLSRFKLQIDKDEWQLMKGKKQSIFSGSLQMMNEFYKNISTPTQVGT